MDVKALNGTQGGVSAGLLDKVQQPTVLAAILTILLIGISTRLLTPSSASSNNGVKTPPIPGYWFPLLGHVPNMIWDTDGFLASLRNVFPQGIFSLNLAGNYHTLICEPSLSGVLVGKPRSVADGGWIGRKLAGTVFGFSKDDLLVFDLFEEALRLQYKNLSAVASLNRMVDTTVSCIKNSIADLVTFNASPADQMNWERLAGAENVETSDGEEYVEVELASLVKNYVASTANTALFGTDFVLNFPDTWQHIWHFDSAFLLLAGNLPTWIPWPRLQRAHFARRQLKSYFREFNEELEKFANGEETGAAWQDLDNVGEIVKGRLHEFRAQNMAMEIRAKYDVGLAWAMNANSSPLVFWMVWEIYRDPVLLEQIRDEIAPYVTAYEPTNEFGKGVWLAPKMDKFDVDGLLNKCPLLKSAYVETLRVYTASWSIKYIQQDFVLKDRGDQEGYFLRKGSYAHAPQELHQFDPKYFPDPNEWQGSRHVKESIGEDGKVVRTADMGTIRPYGGGEAMCKGRMFALREMLMYAAAIVSVYDVKAPGGGDKWKMPKLTKQASAKQPATPVKAWVKRRPLPKEEEMAN